MPCILITLCQRSETLRCNNSPMPQSIFVEQDDGRLVYLTIDREEI